MLSELWLLNVDSRSAIRVRSDYQGVEFKFECFYLDDSKKKENHSISRGSKIASVKDFRGVNAVIRAEWKRPALNNEVPSHYEQVVQDRGYFTNVPHGVPMCISMVGVLFIGEEGGSLGLIHIDGEYPLMLSYIDDAAEIEQFLSECSIVAPCDIAIIRNQFNS